MESLIALANFSDKLAAINNSEKLFDCLIDGIIEIIDCDQASLMTFDSETRKLKLMKVRGFEKNDYKTPRIELVKNINNWINEGGEVFAFTENGENKFLILFDQDESKYFNCELRIPLFAKNNLISILNVGKKSTGTDYSEQDITILRILVNIVSVAIEKAFISDNQSSNKKEPEEKDIKHQKSIQIKRRVDEVKMIGRSAAMQQIHDFIGKVATKDVTVLITGESGTGKDLVARSIHQKSNRHNRPFVAMNCAALPDNLVESELFGHEKGAFTGAHIQKKGKFEFAEGGTLFLDEIGDMSLATQAKLLRVLQDGSFQRTGGNSTLKADVRIIAASNKDLYEEISQGNFREDLYYRINVVQIFIPSLRERKEDIPLLAEYFFEKYNNFYDKGITKIDDKAMARLLEFDFPGNIRELQNIIERAVIMEHSDKLTLDFIPTSRKNAHKNHNTDSNGSLEELEKEHITKVIKQVNYNKSQAARILGIARKTLREKLQKYGLC